MKRKILSCGELRREFIRNWRESVYVTDANFIHLYSEISYWSVKWSEKIEAKWEGGEPKTAEKNARGFGRREQRAKKIGGRIRGKEVITQGFLLLRNIYCIPILGPLKNMYNSFPVVRNLFRMPTCPTGSRPELVICHYHHLVLSPQSWVSCWFAISKVCIKLVSFFAFCEQCRKCMAKSCLVLASVYLDYSNPEMPVVENWNFKVSNFRACWPKISFLLAQNQFSVSSDLSTELRSDLRLIYGFRTKQKVWELIVDLMWGFLTETLILRPQKGWTV